MIVDRLGPITCHFIEIIRSDDDFYVERGDRVTVKTCFELTKSDFVRVSCWTEDNT